MRGQTLSVTRPCAHKSRLVSRGWSMSALLPKADNRQREWHVRYVPEADVTVFAYPFFTGPNHHASGARQNIAFSDPTIRLLQANTPEGGQVGADFISKLSRSRISSSSGEITLKYDVKAALQ